MALTDADIKWLAVYGYDGGCAGGCAEEWCYLCSNTGACPECYDIRPSIDPNCWMCYGFGNCRACGCGNRPPIHIYLSHSDYYCGDAVAGGDYYTTLDDIREHEHGRYYADCIDAGIVCANCLLVAMLTHNDAKALLVNNA